MCSAIASFESSSRAVRLGIAISPLKMSDISHTSETEVTAPAQAHARKIILYIFVLPGARYSHALRPMKNQPIMVAKAKSSIEMPTNISQKEPRPLAKALQITSAPPSEMSTPPVKRTKAVRVQIITVSAKTSAMPHVP